MANYVSGDRMRVQLVPVQPGSRSDLFSILRDELDRDDAGILHIGFAFATLGGVEQFADVMEDCRRWGVVPKQIIIGLHQAISEPSAMAALGKLPHATVRAFLPPGRLSLKTIFGSPVFHAKLLALTSSEARELMFLQSGSANLTSAAAGEEPRNYELCTALSARQGLSKLHPSFNVWWRSVWDTSRNVDTQLIERYARLRDTLVRKGFVRNLSLDPPQSIRQAANFFIEVGAGSGPPEARHQVEFPEPLAHFFGEPQRERRDLTLRSEDRTWHGRPLSFKITTYDVEIWRLGMPTQTAGGPPISSRTIRFERTADPDEFGFEVADVDSPDFLQWLRSANLTGHVGITGGPRGRRYGFF